MGSGKGKGKGEAKGKGKGKLSAPPKGKGKGKGKSEGSGKPAKGKGKSGKGEDKHWVKVKPTVCVTGATGFVASSVIRRLLDKNYKVRGTVRSLAAEDKVGPLKKLFPTLQLFEADLTLGAEGFEKAFEGCTYVMHCASPFIMSWTDPQKELMDPAVKGTEAVMNAAVKCGVTRVVLTSSCAAAGPPQTAMSDPEKADKDEVVSEATWNTTSSITDGAYRYSKTMAEKAAWSIAEANKGKISLATILPAFVIGPMMTSRADAESIKFIKSALDGSLKAKGCNGGCALGVVDVRDVSLAHVAAMEREAAGGERFVVASERGYGQLELCDMIRDKFKAYPIPTEGKEVKFTAKYNNAKVKDDLKVKLRPVDASMRDMANAAIRTGIVERKAPPLKPVTFGSVDDLNPDSKGANLLVKVVSVTEPAVPKGEGKGGGRREAVVGDATGVVILLLNARESEVATAGTVIEIRSGSIRMDKGFMRLTVGKFGNISKTEGDANPTPKTANDISATEFELVPS